MAEFHEILRAWNIRRRRVFSATDIGLSTVERIVFCFNDASRVLSAESVGRESKREGCEDVGYDEEKEEIDGEKDGGGAFAV